MHNKDSIGRSKVQRCALNRALTFHSWIPGQLKNCGFPRGALPGTMELLSMSESKYIQNTFKDMMLIIAHRSYMKLAFSHLTNFSHYFNIPDQYSSFVFGFDLQHGDCNNGSPAEIRYKTWLLDDHCVRASITHRPLRSQSSARIARKI